jgi:hypothetical protein
MGYGNRTSSSDQSPSTLLYTNDLPGTNHRASHESPGMVIAVVRLSIWLYHLTRLPLMRILPDHAGEDGETHPGNGGHLSGERRLSS